MRFYKIRDRVMLVKYLLSVLGGEELDDGAENCGANKNGKIVSVKINRCDKMRESNGDSIGASDGRSNNNGWFHKLDGQSSKNYADNGADGNDLDVGAKILNRNHDGETKNQHGEADFFNREAKQ